MRQGLNFERLCHVDQIDELAGLHALEELLRVGLLCEKVQTEEALEFHEYSFPREIIRKIVYLETGATRQMLVQQRIAAIIQEEKVSHRAINRNRVGSRDAELMNAI